MNKDNDILKDGIDERIESFLQGTMSADEEANFKQEIKSNSELPNHSGTASQEYGHRKSHCQ